MNLSAPRGTTDILPGDIHIWHKIEKTIMRLCKLYGFGEIRFPVFEHTELFERGVGGTTDVVQKEMYTFLDKGGRSVTLRPEGTASAARAYLERSLYALPQPIRLFYMLTCYRYENPQAGRYREFHQFGAEALGSEQPSQDAEIISLAYNLFKSLGLSGVRLNLNSIGCPACRADYHAALKEYFQPHLGTLCKTCNQRYEKNPLRILDCKAPVCGEIADRAPVILDFICEGCGEHFDAVKVCLTELDISFNIDPYIVRGLDYYTRTVFEFVTEETGAQSTICGGGRYDGLVEELGGTPTPSIGFAMGLERLIYIMNKEGLVLSETDKPDIYIASMEGTKTAALRLAHSLRDNGVCAICDHMNRSLKAQMKYANKLGARYALVLGGDEMASGRARLKNMHDGATADVELSAQSIKKMIHANEEDCNYE